MIIYNNEVQTSKKKFNKSLDRIMLKKLYFDLVDFI